MMYRQSVSLLVMLMLINLMRPCVVVDAFCLTDSDCSFWRPNINCVWFHCVPKSCRSDEDCRLWGWTSHFCLNSQHTFFGTNCVVKRASKSVCYGDNSCISGNCDWFFGTFGWLSFDILNKMNKLIDTSFDGSSYEHDSSDDTNSNNSDNVSFCGKQFNIKRKELTPLILLSSFFFFNYLYFSLFVPFFPGVARDKGMNQLQIGSIFAVFQLVQVFLAPFFGKHIEQIGVRFLFIGGLFLSSTTEILFGFLNDSPDGYPYFIICLLCRGVTAIGSSMCHSYAIVGHLFPSKVSYVVGVLEVFSGLGLIAGPVLGGFLYQMGGFPLPFFTIGGLQFVLLILAFIWFPNTDATDQSIDSKKKEPAYPMLPLFKLPQFFFTMLMLFCSALSINFVEPSIQLHLMPLGLSSIQLGFVFLVPAFIYVVVTPMVGLICDKFPKSMPWLMIVSIICSIGSYSLLGPLSYFNLPLKLWIFLIGYALFSLSFSGLIVPVYAELLKIAVANGYPNDLRTQGVISGLFGSVYSIGALFGPLAGGLVVDFYGFDMATFFIVILFAVTGFLYTVSYLIGCVSSQVPIADRDSETSALIN